MTETLTCPPSVPRTTIEQVASKLMPAMLSRRDAGFGQRASHGAADRAPDVLGIVLGMIGLRPMHQDRMLGAAEQRARAVEDAGARAPRPDIDGADVSLHQPARPPIREGTSARRSGNRAMSAKISSGCSRTSPASSAGLPRHASRR